MQPSPDGPTHHASPAKKESWRRPILMIVAMVGLFLLVVGFRDDIRVRWWGYRLVQSSNVAERMPYLQLLSNSDAHALPVARRLIQHSDLGNRSFGVALISTISGDEADRLLEAACLDADESIRESAILGLSMRSSVETVSRLMRLIDHTDEASAMFATNRLESINLPESLAALSRVARSHPNAGVRAQAIVSLGQWGGDDVVGTLIDCLPDDAVFGGVTATEAQAREALGSLVPQFASTNGARINQHPGDTNGMRAARILQTVTGRSFNFLEANEVERLSAIQRWREWFESQDDG